MRTRLALPLLLLLAACSLAAVVAVQSVERSGSLIGRPSVTSAFSPNGDGARDIAGLTLRPRSRDEFDVTIVDTTGRVVRQLASNVRSSGHARFVWDGTSADGAVASEGTYHALVELTDSEREIVIPTPIRLDLSPPRVLKLRLDTTRLESRGVLRVRVVVRDAATMRVVAGDEPLETVRVIRRKLRGPRVPLGKGRVILVVRAPDANGSASDLAPRDLVFEATDAAGNTVAVPLPAEPDEELR